MERLTLNRRPKPGDRTECLPAGDGLPIWTTIPLDAKLPMMQNPKGSVVLYTTKLGDPKHRCKQEYDFDLRDPNGQYICNEYKPLHDPHLKAHFNSTMMRRHLIKKGFISEDGKILCSLKEFNQYRQYLRHIFFLEIARERKEQLEERHKQKSRDRDGDVTRKVSQGTVVRRRLQQQRERQLAKLKKDISVKTDRLEQRLKAIRAEMATRERRQREEAERRQMALFKNQQEMEQRNLTLMKRWRQRERMRNRLMQDRETQRRLQAEMKCLAKWNSRKKVQHDKLERDETILDQEEQERMRNISRREQVVTKQRQLLEERIDTLKQKTREEMQRQNEVYAKRFEKLSARDFRPWKKRKDKKGRTQTRTFNSTWQLEDVLRNFEIPEMKKPATEPPHTLLGTMGPETTTDAPIHYSEADEELIQAKAREIVNDVIEEVKNDIFPAYLKSVEEKECDATQSRSVRFSSEEQNIEVVVNEDRESEDSLHYRPVVEHILTPCASQLEIQRLEAEARLGSPDSTDQPQAVSFVETLLLRLLDDLNSGRLSKDDIMKLATYSMEIIQSTEAEDIKDEVLEVQEDSDYEGPYLAASSSSILAKKLVDFTLGKILDDIQSGNIHHDDLASLTVSLLDSAAYGDSSASISISDAEIDAYIDDTLRAATSSALDPRDDSPVCDALLDDFMINTLKKLIQDLEEEALTKSQVETLAISVHGEKRRILPENTECEIQSAKDIQNVLMDILAQLHTGGIDMQSLYQIVFSIVYSYNMIVAAPTPCFENKVSELMKEIFDTVEKKAIAENIDSVDTNILHQASNRLSQSNLTVELIEKVSSSIIRVVSQPEVSCRTSTSEIARSIVEEALLKTQHSLQSESLDEVIAHSVQTLAESVLVNLDAGQDNYDAESPNLSDVFVEFLECLQSVVRETGEVGAFSESEIDELITQITRRLLPSGQIEEMATSVVRILKSPVKSESSLTASVVVKNVLQKVRADLMQGSVEDSIISEMIQTLKTCCRTAQANDSKSPALLHSLSSFLRTLLNHVTYKVECGEFDEEDLAELSKALKGNINKETTFVLQSEDGCSVTDKEPFAAKDEATSTNDEEFINIPTHKHEEMTYLQDARNVLEHLNILLCEIESEVFDDETANDLAQKLIDCGNKLLTSLGDKESAVCTPGTDTIAEEVVEQVIRTLQLEIDSGMLSNDSLKEVTKVLMSTKSDSDIASELVGYTIRGIHRDVERGYDLRQIPSIPTIVQSPSVSTVASHVVGHTLEMINREIEAKGITREMLSSIASSVLTMVSDENIPLSSLSVSFEKVRKTVTKIIECLKDDKISQREAERIFRMILEKYKLYILGSGHDVIASKSEAQLSIEDGELIDELVKETLKNIERSVAKGRMSNKQFSIPSLPHSDDSSIIAERLIEACFDSMKHDLTETKMPPWPKPDIVDFIQEILSKMREELIRGNVTDLSMAHFFQAISHDTSSLKVLETMASENLNNVILHIEQHRSNSVYVHRILETYLSPDHTQDSIYSDPVKAIESILVAVSSDILSKFVKATIQNILLEIREGNTSVVQKPTSMYVLRSATSIIAENVVKEVIIRIKTDMTSYVHQLQGNVNMKELERAASRLLVDSPKDEPFGDQDGLQDQSKQSTSSGMSKEVEDLVLETLHNIVSNLRLEQSIQSQNDGKPGEKGSEASQEIQDFVLHSLQNIVTDLQDRRSHADLEPTKIGKLSYASSTELLHAESREAMAYVNEVLQTVIRDMKIELASKSPDDGTNAAEFVDDLNMESMIMGNLQNALSGCALPVHEYTLETTQKDEVKRILIESINGTIANIQQEKFDSDGLLSMYSAMTRFVEKDDAVCKNPEAVRSDEVIDLMENVLTMVETMGLDDETLNKIATHLASLGMESVGSGRKSPSLAYSVSSVSSSKISELIKDVLIKISQQLTNDDDEEESMKSSLSSLKNKNYNRRLSASSAATTLSGTAVLDDSDRLVKTKSPRKSVGNNDNGVREYVKNAKNITRESTSPREKQIQRSIEARQAIRKEPIVQSSSPGNNKKQSKKRDSSQKALRETEVRMALSTGSAEKAKAKRSINEHDVNRNIALPKGEVNVKSSKSERKTKQVIAKPANKGSCIQLKQSSSLPKTATQGHSFKSPTRRRQSSGKKERILSSSPKPKQKLNIPEGPVELKSLCGVHKTKIKLRGVVQTPEITTPADQIDQNGTDYSNC